MTKIFPAYRENYAATSNATSSIHIEQPHPEHAQTKPQPQVQHQPQKKAAPKENAGKPTSSITNSSNNNQNPKPKLEHIDASAFKPEELKDPDIADNLNSMKVLDFKINELDAKIKKIEGRTPKPLREKLIKMKCKKKVLEESLGESINPTQYVEMMKTQFKHDKQ